jgi:tetratricopeptide (TPR) repeat protein
MMGLLATYAQQDTNSYDFRFSRAANHFREGNFNLALEGYKQLFREYHEIGELSSKIGSCYLRLEQFDSAKTYFIRTISMTPNDIEALTKLAFIAGIEGKTDSAIYIYQQIIKIEPTYAEAYAGLGKMYYWKNKPKSALRYYDKALQLDPTNSDYLAYRKMIKKELAYQLTATVMYVSEREETYQISALIQRYGVEKRFSEYFSLSVNTLWDYSLRNNVFESDVRRWFDNSWLKANFIFKNQLISAFAGASGLENMFTSYELAGIPHLQLKNYKSKTILRLLTITTTTGTILAMTIIKICSASAIRN